MTLPLEEVVRYLGLRGGTPDEALTARTRELMALAPLVPRRVFRRFGDRYLLCGTVGSAFDAWQRRLAADSAADAFIAQAIGTAAVERVMDDAETEIRAELVPGEKLQPRRSPGYGRMPLARNGEIIRLLDATKLIGVASTAADLLVPSKSVTAEAMIQRESVKA